MKGQVDFGVWQGVNKKARAGFKAGSHGRRHTGMRLP